MMRTWHFHSHGPGFSPKWNKISQNQKSTAKNNSLFICLKPPLNYTIFVDGEYIVVFLEWQSLRHMPDAP